MPIIAVDADMQGKHSPSPAGNIDFSFLPQVLIDKCKPFVIHYHELNGFSSLPDILWQPETYKFIEADLTLKRLFKKSTLSRSARRANEGFVVIAALILSTEILALRLAGWATRYPVAHKKARALIAEYVPGSRALLTERYLYPQIVRSGAVLRIVAPCDLTQADQQRRVPPKLKENVQ